MRKGNSSAYFLDVIHVAKDGEQFLKYKNFEGSHFKKNLILMIDLA
jgi:hypothetical protein